jgi:LPS sulfotransferase NodH
MTDLPDPIDEAYRRRSVEGAIGPRRFSGAAALARAWRDGHLGLGEYRRMQPVFVIGAQRSGTTVLREVLNTNPAVALLGELFDTGSHQRDFAWFASEHKLPRAADYAEAERQLWGFLRHVRGLVPATAARFGFDVKYSQLRTLAPLYEPLSAVPAMVQFIHASRALVVHVVRDNILQAALSEMVARSRAVWHHRGQQSIEQPVEIDCRVLGVIMRQKQADREIFTAQMRAYPRLATCEYGEIVRGLDACDAAGRLVGPDNPFFAIADFLGVERRFDRGQLMRKVIQRPYREIVANYREMVASVRRTEFARFIETI